MSEVGLTNESLWSATARIPDRVPLREDLVTDVCVIGAGIAGLSTAYALTRAGKQVVVLEVNAVGSGMTSRTTSHLTYAVDGGYAELERMHGSDATRLAAQAHGAAIDTMEEIVEREGIRCGFARVDGYLTLGCDDDLTTLQDDLAAAHRSGLERVELIRKACYPGRGVEPCLRFPRQGRLHPMHYLAGLAEGIERAGGRVYCGTRVDDVQDSSPVEVRAGDVTVRAQAVVVATSTPITERVAIHVKQAPYMSYAIAALVPHAGAADALFWDTEDPYHYVRLEPAKDGSGRDYLIVGGEDHKTGQASDAQQRFARIEEWARERFPEMGRVEYAWSGEIMEAADRLAFIGRSPSSEHEVFVVTGESGMGMTHGTIAAAIITDAVMGRENPWAELYDPGRRTFRSAAAVVKENLNVAAQYADWLTPGDVGSTDAIGPRGGAVLRRGLRKVAVYRDADGTLHERSAVCPHLGCIVRWNAGEETWDCPCHGSRFDAHGHWLVVPPNATSRHCLTRSERAHHDAGHRICH
ncbi:MAG: FAD-dependent oxidoreductase [Gemmatimonadaceae bacterium]